ncbi:MAG: hypothetical protein JRF33_20405 [Deltaproteobacteria bacterium]|nr:hypothetical protein [Deltaproteobacteria bacterium]
MPAWIFLLPMNDIKTLPDRNLLSRSGLKRCPRAWRTLRLPEVNTTTGRGYDLGLTTTSASTPSRAIRVTRLDPIHTIRTTASLGVAKRTNIFVSFTTKTNKEKRQ